MISKTQQIFLNILKGNIPSQLEGVDTNELFELFQRHRLFSLAPALKELVEEEEWQRWKQAIQSRTLRSLHQTSALTQFIKAFEKEGIEAIPLKGPILAQTLYGNIADRHYSDLDILIRDADIHKIIEIAGREGYELSYPAKMLSPRKWAYYFKYKKDIGLIHRQQKIFIELHAGVYYHKLMEQDGEKMLWENLVDDKIGNCAIRRMDNNSTFLYLTFHGGLHQYFRLFWLRDVAISIKNMEIDHQQIIEMAELLGIERLLFVSVVLAQKYFNVDIPEDYQNHISSDILRINKIKDICVDRIEGQEHSSFRDRLYIHLMFLLLKPSLRFYMAGFSGILNRWYIKKFLGGH